MEIGPVHKKLSFIPAFGVILQLLSTLIIILRIQVRRKNLNVEDAFVFFAWAATTALTILAIDVVLRHNYADQVGDSSPADRVQFTYYVWIFETLYLIAVSCVKISLFTCYHALASRLKRSAMLWVIRSTIILTSFYFLAFFALHFASCRPFDAYWRSLDPLYTQSYACLDGVAVMAASSIVNTLLDLVALLIPAFLFYQYKWEDKPKPRVGLYVLCSLGILVLAFGIMRIALVSELNHALEKQHTWTLQLIFFAALWQIHLALVCACLPTVTIFSKSLVSHVESFLQKIRFMRGQNLNATKRLDSRSSDRSLRSKQNSPDLKKNQVGATAANEKGREKALPPAPETDVEKHGNGDRLGSITVAYRVDEQSPTLEVQSPTLPPESKWRLSAHSFHTSGSFSRWSGIRTPKTVMLKSGHTTPLSPASPNRSMQFPRSPGLSQIDVHEEADDIPDVPPMPDMAHIDPALSGGYVACRGCGLYHPHGYRHDQGQEQVAQTSRFDLWWKLSHGRGSGRWKPSSPRPSTFFNDNDDDDDDEEVPVV